MWTNNKLEEKSLKSKRESDKLKGYIISKNIKITTSLKRAVKNSRNYKKAYKRFNL